MKNNKRIRVLLVEDTASISLSIMIFVQRFYNAKIDLVGDGISGLKKATEKNYDVILLDIGLPRMLGLEVVEKIQQLEDTQKAHVPIIILSASFNMRGHMGKCKELGVPLLEKPIKLEPLKLLIDSILLKEDKIK